MIKMHFTIQVIGYPGLYGIVDMGRWVHRNIESLKRLGWYLPGVEFLHVSEEEDHFMKLV